MRTNSSDQRTKFPNNTARARGAAAAEGHGLTAQGSRHGEDGRAVDVLLGPGFGPTLRPALGPIESNPRGTERVGLDEGRMCVEFVPSLSAGVCTQYGLYGSGYISVSICLCVFLRVQSVAISKFPWCPI